MTEHTRDERDAAIDKLQAELDRAEAKLKELEAAGRSRAANSDFKHAIAERRDRARASMERLRQGGSDAWDELKGGFSRAYEDLREAVRR